MQLIYIFIGISYNPSVFSNLISGTIGQWVGLWMRQVLVVWLDPERRKRKSIYFIL